MTFTDEETTRTGMKRVTSSAQSKPPELSADLHEALGQVMAATAQTQASVKIMRAEMQTLQSELGQLRRDIELDRKALVHGASSRAATHTSNRMAALLGALFVLYEQAAPVLRALWEASRGHR